MNYLLSPQDLYGLDHVPDLVRAGVSCLKIEGRLKDAKYAVAATTRAYRNAVDLAWKNLVTERDRRDSSSSVHRRVLDIDETVTKEELTQLFARGQNEAHDGLVSGYLRIQNMFSIFYCL